MTERSLRQDADDIWRWEPTTSGSAARRLRRWAVVWAVATLACLALAAIRPGRSTIVFAVMVAGLGVIGIVLHRRFRSTAMRIDAAGVFTVGDSSSQKTIDLCTIDTVEFRRRVSESEGLSDTSAWELVLTGPDHALTHRLAQVGGVFNLDESDIRAIETDLRAHVVRLGATRAAETRPGVAARPAALSDPFDTSRPAVSQPLGSPGSTGRYEWHPPVSPKAASRRRWYRIAYVGVAVTVAVFAFMSEYDNGLDAAIISAAAVPGFLLLVGVAFDAVLGRNRRFVISVDQGTLTVRSGFGKESATTLPGATVMIDVRSHAVADGRGGTTRTTRWYLTVDRPDGAQLVRQFPSLGVTTTSEDYALLERELRSRT